MKSVDRANYVVPGSGDPYQDSPQPIGGDYWHFHDVVYLFLSRHDNVTTNLTPRE